MRSTNVYCWAGRGIRWPGAVQACSSGHVSLSVYTVLFAEDGKMTLLDAPAPGADLAGFESFRTEVWGSDAVRALGSRYFPILASGNLIVPPEEVEDFLRECATVRTKLEKIGPHDDLGHSHEWYVETISGRLANIQAAAERALKAGGGVLIW